MGKRCCPNWYSVTHSWHAGIRTETSHSWPRLCPISPLVHPVTGLGWLMGQVSPLFPSQWSLKKYFTFPSFFVLMMCLNMFMTTAAKNTISQFQGDRGRSKYRVHILHSCPLFSLDLLSDFSYQKSSTWPFPEQIVFHKLEI